MFWQPARWCWQDYSPHPQSIAVTENKKGFFFSLLQRGKSSPCQRLSWSSPSSPVRTLLTVCSWRSAFNSAASVSALQIRTKALGCVRMHRVMLIGSLVGSHLAQLCPTSKCPPNPPEPPTYRSLLGIAAEMEYALNTSYCTLNNLGISAELGRGAWCAPTERIIRVLLEMRMKLQQLTWRGFQLWMKFPLAVSGLMCNSISGENVAQLKCWWWCCWRINGHHVQ